MKNNLFDKEPEADIKFARETRANAKENKPEAELKFAANTDALDETEKIIIESIAPQCPYAGGKAVYIARNLIAQVNDSMVYDDANVCLQLGIYRQTTKESGISLGSNNFKIVPNPVTDFVSIIFENEAEEDCNIKIIDKLSKVVYIKPILKGTKQLRINLVNLKAGVYQVTIESDAFASKAGKLVFVK